MSRMYLLKLALIWYVFRSAANPAQLEPPLPIDAPTTLKKDIPACQKHLAGSIWVRKISPICLRWHSCHTQPFSWRVGGRDLTSRSEGGAWCPGWEEVWSQKSLNLESKVEDIVAIFTFKVCCRRQWQLPSCSQYSEVKPSPATTNSHLYFLTSSPSIAGKLDMSFLDHQLFSWSHWFALPTATAATITLSDVCLFYSGSERTQFLV